MKEYFHLLYTWYLVYFIPFLLYLVVFWIYYILFHFHLLPIIDIFTLHILEEPQPIIHDTWLVYQFYTRTSLYSVNDWYIEDELATNIILTCLLVRVKPFLEKNYPQFIFHFFSSSGFIYCINFILFQFYLFWHSLRIWPSVLRTYLF